MWDSNDFPMTSRRTGPGGSILSSAIFHVERISDSEWWRNPHPTSKDEGRVSEARAAFLDSLYYVEV